MLAGIRADWTEAIATAVGAAITLGLLAFEMNAARKERQQRESAEAQSKRDLSVERARRVFAWVEPILWQVNREGVVNDLPGGWKLVVSNDTDDTISNWHAAVIRPAVHGVDEVLLEAAVVEHGVIAPRSRFEADLEFGSDIPPAHSDTPGITTLRWVDRDASFWHTRGAAGPFQIPAEDGRWSINDSLRAARRGGRRETRTQSYVVARLN